MDKIVFPPLIAVNEMLTICQLTYHPRFDTQFRHGQTRNALLLCLREKNESDRAAFLYQRER